MENEKKESRLVRILRYFSGRSDPELPRIDARITCINIEFKPVEIARNNLRYLAIVNLNNQFYNYAYTLTDSVLTYQAFTDDWKYLLLIPFVEGVRALTNLFHKLRKKYIYGGLYEEIEKYSREQEKYQSLEETADY